MDPASGPHQQRASWQRECLPSFPHTCAGSEGDPGMGGCVQPGRGRQLSDLPSAG